MPPVWPNGAGWRVSQAELTLPRREDTWTDPFAQDPPLEDEEGEEDAASKQPPSA